MTYTVSGHQNTEAGSYILTVTGTGNFTGTAMKAYTIAKVSADELEILLGAPLTYNGQLQTQEVLAVKLNGRSVPFRVTGHQQVDAGDYWLTISSDNHAFDPIAYPYTIARRPVALVGTAAESKTYDGTTKAAIATPGILPEAVPGDDLTVTPGQAAFADPQAGSNKSVTFAGFSLSGQDQANYVLTSQPAASTADILPKPLTVQVKIRDKDFDNTLEAQYESAALQGVIPGDTVLLSVGKAQFSEVYGENLPIRFTAFTLSGKDAANYQIVQPTGITATIYPDKTAPVISGVEEGVTYYAEQQVAVTDLWLDSVTLNGNPVTASFTLPCKEDAVYTIAATDVFGNTACITVYMKVPSVQTFYQIIEGNGAEWTRGSGKTVRLVSDGPYDKYLDLTVDGRTVNRKDYTSAQGSTLITLTPSYLKTLSVGDHAVRFVYTDVEANGFIRILEATVEHEPDDIPLPPTGDDFPLTTLILLMALSLSSLLLLLKQRPLSK